MTHNAERTPLGGAAAWTGAELERDRSWIRHLDAADIAALDAALDHVRARGLDWSRIGRADFPLGDFGAQLAKIADELENGRGIALLRGLPVGRYDAEALKCIHYGLASHLGTPVYQSARGELIGEITDEGAAALSRGTLQGAGDGEVFLSSRARVQSTGALRWHTDRADVVALLCAEQSMAGGVSQIASAVAIHDTMLARRPDLVDELYGDIPRSRLGEEIGGEAAHYMLPVFALQEGHFTTHYSRTYVEAGQKVATVPRMSAAQWEALDLLHALGHELCLTHRFRPGDIQYLNNHVLYHGRTAYEDGTGGRRLLYRIWISMPNSRPLPAGHAVLFVETGAGAVRGGIRQPDGRNVPVGVDLDPPILRGGAGGMAGQDPLADDRSDPAPGSGLVRAPPLRG
ncbi:MAG: TauD/TfdA family dioxygenase [Paracoccaceae bacterium]